MDTWIYAAGWIAFLWAVAIGLLRERWHGAELAQLRRQLADTERELWNAQTRATYWEGMVGDVRRGIIPPVPPARDGRRLPVTYRGDTGDHD